jgi:hypothetical protein
MPTQIVPAASLRSACRFPAARALLGAVNHLICMVLSSIGRAIFGVALNFSLLSGRARYQAASGSVRITTGRRLPRYLTALIFAGW